MVTTLTHYKDGMAAVLIINHTERCDLKFNQRYAKPFYHFNSHGHEVLKVSYCDHSVSVVYHTV